MHRGAAVQIRTRRYRAHTHTLSWMLHPGFVAHSNAPVSLFCIITSVYQIHCGWRKCTQAGHVCQLYAVEEKKKKR